MSALLKKKMKIAGGLRQKPFKMKIFSILWVNWSRNIFCRILIGKNQMKIDSTLRLFDHAFCTMLEIYRIIKSNNTKIFGTQFFAFSCNSQTIKRKQYHLLINCHYIRDSGTLHHYISWFKQFQGIKNQRFFCFGKKRAGVKISVVPLL